MSVYVPHTAMVFAAGLGKRMRSHRSDIPKPLVPVAGRTLIDRVLDKLVEAGVKTAVINVSYLGQQIIEHVTATRQDIALVFSEEEQPLETGGGIVRAMASLGNDPFYAINSDICWVDGFTPALIRLAQGYDAARMDALLLACPTARTTGYDGVGDFVLDQRGQVRRRGEREVSPYVFGGIQILHPRLFTPYLAQEETPVFSLNQLFRRAGDGWFDRIHAISHDATWMHIGDAKGVAEAEAWFATRFSNT